SEPALELASASARLNALEQVSFERAEVFARLESLVAEGHRFDLVVLDPPKFARSGNAVDEAMRGYRRLQSLALKLLDPNGILAVCCCSGLITMQMLHELLAELAAEHKRPMRILQSRGPAADHPIAANCLETAYL